MAEEKMSIKNQFIFANIGLTSGVLVFSFVYPWQVVLLTSIVMYPFVNLILYFKAKKQKDISEK